MTKKCILIDGAGLVYRSFFAIPKTLTDSHGKPTNAVLGFTNILLSILLTHKPDYLAIAFDKKGPTFRHREYKAYKATRVKQPQELYDQIPMAKEVAEAMGIPVFEAENFEADDVIATMADTLARDHNMEILIATGDFDIFQTVRGHVKILYPEKGFRESKIFTAKEISEKYGIMPSQVTDYKGLAGDASDNIPYVFDAPAAEDLKRADMVIFFEKNPKFYTLAFQNLCVPVAPFLDEKTKNYNAVAEQGNGFFFHLENKWEIFAALIRACETFQFPYDWENLLRAIHRSLTESRGFFKNH